MPWNEISVILTRSWTGSSPGSPWTTPCVRGDTFVGHSHVVSCFSAASVAEAVKRFLQKKYWIRLSPLCSNINWIFAYKINFFVDRLGDLTLVFQKREPELDIGSVHHPQSFFLGHRRCTPPIAFPLRRRLRRSQVQQWEDEDTHGISILEERLWNRL